MIERIGRYTIDRKLGEGGMGVVYAAHDPRLERSVAIKTVRGHEGDDAARQRLWREARAAARVSHPNVCQLHEIDEEDGVLYLVMELLEGETLEARIARGAVPLEECLQITLAILAALDALHAQDVIHRSHGVPAATGGARAGAVYQPGSLPRRFRFSLTLAHTLARAAGQGGRHGCRAPIAAGVQVREQTRGRRPAHTGGATNTAAGHGLSPPPIAAVGAASHAGLLHRCLDLSAV
jgi:hypothetical protein